MAEPVVLINSFEVPDGDAETFISAWERTRDYLTCAATGPTPPVPGHPHLTACRSAPRPARITALHQRLVADDGPDPQPRLVQAALEGGLADPGDLRGLLGGQALDVAQHDRCPQRGRQLGQGLAEGPAQLVVLGLPGRVSAGEAGSCSSSAPIGTPPAAGASCPGRGWPR